MAKTEDLGRYDLSTLRCAVSAGEPLNQEVINTFSVSSISQSVMVTARRKAP